MPRTSSCSSTKRSPSKCNGIRGRFVLRVNFLSADYQKFFMQGPMKQHIEEWWQEGTTKECMLSA
eukprot:6072655-Prorocentrum_lima.AAC.1